MVSVASGSREQGVDLGKRRLRLHRHALSRRAELAGEIDGVAVEDGLAHPGPLVDTCDAHVLRSEEHTAELTSLMRSCYAVFGLTKKKKTITLQIMSLLP